MTCGKQCIDRLVQALCGDFGGHGPPVGVTEDGVCLQRGHLQDQPHPLPVPGNYGCCHSCAPTGCRPSSARRTRWRTSRADCTPRGSGDDPGEGRAPVAHGARALSAGPGAPLVLAIALVRNPLAEPYLLGVSSRASLGAVVQRGPRGRANHRSAAGAIGSGGRVGAPPRTGATRHGKCTLWLPIAARPRGGVEHG